MKILAIHDGHNATACYLDNGRVVSLVSEEIFVNKKNQGGFPKNAVEWILKKHSLTFDSFDAIAFANLIYTHDFSAGYGQSPRHRLIYTINRFLPYFIKSSHKIVEPYVKFFGIFRRSMLKKYAGKFGFDWNKVRQVEHHTAHAYAALYGSDLVNGKDQVLIFTADDSGDGISSRVAAWDRDGGYRILKEFSSFHSLGNLYSNVTRYLGMKAGEHEYKIMGMAPYVPYEKSERVFKKFLSYINIDSDGNIFNTADYGPIMLKRFKKDFFLERFDNICGGIQRHFEYVIVEWVKYWAKKTGIKKAVFGGGCFMNVKANMLICGLSDFDDVFFCPSSGDESTALGAAYRIAEEMKEKHIYPVGHLYRGPSFDSDSIEKELLRNDDKVAWIRSSDVEKDVALLLKDGKIIARFKGPAEWGARALGARSILCRADDLRAIHRLNKSIKNRDFWMPFAASIIKEDADEYIHNPRKLPAPYMILTFMTTEKARNDICAALHPFDYTCRPQLVTEEENPDYYKLLKHFKELTGLSGILNTSFNLHGYPVAGTPETALKTLLNSGLDYLVIEDFIVRKK